MVDSKSLENQVGTIISTPWNKRSGRKVPETTEVAYGGGAVELEATFLYADLANSSKIAKAFDQRVAAKIIKSYLATSSSLIKSCGGKIVSFDGDRVLGVFYDGPKSTNAVKCALHINYVLTHIIRPKFENAYDPVRNASFRISHGVGIDTGKVLVVRAGARGDNDLVWIGRAPNLAAKLSDLRESPYSTFITAPVYNCMLDSSKFGGNPSQNMWQKRVWTFLDDRISVYRSSWWWKP